MSYQNIPGLRAAGEKVEMTAEQINEYIKCQEDILYFAENYFYIQTIDEGRKKIPLWEFQKKLLKVMIDPPDGKRHIVVLSARQMSKTTVSTIFLLHYALFNKEGNLAILANNEKTSKDILSKIQMAYLNLPLWLQQGISDAGWNKNSLSLENGIQIFAASTSSNSIRGKTISALFVDESAHIADYIWDEFYNSVLPTISSGKKSKIIMVSTPKGLNHFYNIYKDATMGKNNYYPVKISWYERPDRDDKWKQDTLKDCGSMARFLQEYDCRFLGSSNTLIEGDMLERIETQTATTLKYNGAMLIYEEPTPNDFYIMGVDSAKGGGNDYSVIQVLKINGERDVEQVAVYRNNLISPDDFAQVCIGVSDYYNNAYMMVENNDVGQVVADAIWYDYECDRIVNCDGKGLGIRSTKKTKLAGNLLLKKYVENGYVQINDSRTLYELSRYEEVSPNVFHAAGQNDNDDCVTSLIWALYYLTTPFYDKDDNNISRKDISDKYKIEDDRPIFYDEGVDENWINGF